MTSGRVFTIGHGNHTREALLIQLNRTAVNYLVDVRSAPFSKYQPEFSRPSLETFLQRNRVRYVFMGDVLGGRPRNEACYTDGKVDYSKTRAQEFFARGIDRLKSAYDQGLSVCLLCSEGQPSKCHRAKLVSVALADHGIDVTHILPDGSLRTHAQVIAEVTNGQPSLFGEHFVSRKIYQ